MTRRGLEVRGNRENASLTWSWADQTLNSQPGARPAAPSWSLPERGRSGL